MGGFLRPELVWREAHGVGLACAAGLLALTLPLVSLAAYEGTGTTQLVVTVVGVLFLLYLLVMLILYARRLWAGTGGYSVVCAVVFVITVLLRIYYVIMTKYTFLQHDSWGLDAMAGHVVYIFRLADNGLRLLDVDPTSLWSFYNPPLSYYLGAAWVCAGRALGLADAQAAESLQWLSLAYSVGATYVGYLVLRQARLEGRALALGFCAWALVPFFVPLSGNVSYDGLLTLLSLVTLLLLMRWYEDPTLARALRAGVCLGLALMTKTTAALLLLPALVTFILRLVRREGRPSAARLALQVAAVLVPAAVLGGWWHVYAYLRFGMPFGYFQKVDPTDPMNCSAYSLAQRLLPSWEGDFAPFYYVDVAGDYSIPVILLKTATFDLVGKVVPKGPLFAIGTVLDALGAALVLGAVCGLVFCLSDLRSHSHEQVLPIALMASVLVAYAIGILQLSFSQPFSCSSNFRYIVPVALAGAFFLSRLGHRRLAGRACWVCLADYAVAQVAFWAGMGLTFG